MLPELTKNWKIGILGPWRDFDSKWPAPNGAPASYLSPGWHDRPPHGGIAWDMDGDLSEKWPPRGPQNRRSAGRLGIENRSAPRTDLGREMPNPALKPKKYKFSGPKRPISIIWGSPLGAIILPCVPVCLLGRGRDYLSIRAAT